MLPRLGDLARPIGRRGVDDEDLVEQRDATDHLPDRLAHDRADRLLFVERRQHQRDRDALLLLELDRRRKSPNSAWWKFDSPNQRSTRAGTARASSAARSAAINDLLFRERVERRAADLLARLDDDDRRLGRAAIASGSAPNRYESAPSPPGTAEAPITTRSAFSASRRMALRTLGASRRTASPLPFRCCLMNVASACSAWARTAIVMPGGTRWSTTTVAL